MESTVCIYIHFSISKKNKKKHKQHSKRYINRRPTGFHLLFSTQMMRDRNMQHNEKAAQFNCILLSITQLFLSIKVTQL